MSLSWKSQSFTMKSQWKRVENNLRRMRLDRSPCIPKNLEEYARHVIEFAADQTHFQTLKTQTAKADLEVAVRLGRRYTIIFDNNDFGDGRTGVLGHKTIWSKGWSPEPDHPLVRWPEPQEFKEEGDERHTSTFGRYLPLLRYPGNETVNWKQRPRLLEYSMDEVMPVPRKCPVVIPHLYGFDLELDFNGIPYDDDEVPGGSVAVAYHLDEEGEDIEDVPLGKFMQLQAFIHKFSAQIYGFNEVVPYTNDNGNNTDESSEEEESDNMSFFDMRSVSAADTKNEEDKKGKKPFSFNPKASEFVSAVSSPADSDKSESPVEGPAKAPCDVFALINHINSMTAKKTGHKVDKVAGPNHGHSSSNLVDNSLTPATTYGTSVQESDGFEHFFEDPSTILAHAMPLPSTKTQRGSSFGAIGSERHSSGDAGCIDPEDVESDIDGGVPLCESFSTVMANHDSEEDEEQVSPKTIPARMASLMAGPNGVRSHFAEGRSHRPRFTEDNPATLADLVANSQSDEEEDDYFGF